MPCRTDTGRMCVGDLSQSYCLLDVFFASIGNESVPKIIINDTMFFFLNCSQHFGDFKP